MFIFCPVHFWHSLKWMWTPSASYFAIHLKQSFHSFLTVISTQCGKSALLLMPLATSESATFLHLSVSRYLSHVGLFCWFPFFFSLFNLTTPLGMWDISLQPGVKPKDSSCIGSSESTTGHPGKPLFCWFLFKKPLLLSLHPHSYTQTHTYRTTITSIFLFIILSVSLLTS